MRGEYVIKTNKKTYIGHNLITLLGESLFLNRCVNNEFKPIEYIVLGNSSVPAKKSDLTLGNETVRKKAVTSVDLANKRLIFTAQFPVSEVMNTTEIGVSTENVLISHDTYLLDKDFLDDTIDTVEITYYLELTTSARKTNWELYNAENHIYYTIEENTVVGVIEEDSQSGYHSLKNLDSLKNHAGAYYYDNQSKALYIRTTKDDNPQNYTITIQTKG